MKKNIIVLLLLLLGAFFLAGCVPKNEAETHFSNATAFLEMQMFKEAIIELKNGLRLKEKDAAFNDRPEKPTLLATIYLYDNKVDEAKMVLEEAVKKYKRDWNIHLLLASVYMNKKDYRKAAETMEELPLRIQDYGEIDLMWGLRYFGENRYEEAEKRFLQAKEKFLAQSLKFKQESGSSQFIKAGATIMIDTLLGNVYDKEGKLPEAAAVYEEALKINPNSEALLTNVDIIKRKLYLKGNPQDANAHNSLGWLYHQKGLPAEAILEYRLAIKYDFSYALAYNNLGLVYFDNKQYELAIASFNKTIALDNDKKALEYAYYNLGRAYRKTKDIKKAIESLAKAMALNSQSLSVQREYKIAFLMNDKKANYFDLGNLLFENEEYQEAASVYQDLLAVKPNNYQADYNLGQCYLKLGEMAKAIAPFKAAIKINPQYWQAHRMLGLVYAELENYDEAASEFDLAIENADKDKLSDIYNDLAYIYSKKGDLELAAKTWRMAAKYDKKKAEKIDKILGVIG
ncbi:MAG: tetratricopeptide repeat protein [Candidatus Margulisiibacteriota bacterium]